MSEALFIPRWARNIKFSPTGHITQSDTQSAVAGLDTRVYTLETAGGGASVSYPDLYLVTAYGAVADGKNVQSGAITAGSNVLNINVRTTTPPALNPLWTPPNFESQFSFLDIGKNIILTGAGAAGGWLKTTITGCNSTTQVILAASASTTVTIDMPVSWGTDNTATFQAALNDVVQVKQGGTIGVPIGKYLFLGNLVYPNADTVNGGMQGGLVVFRGMVDGTPEYNSYRDVDAPVLMITDEVNNFIQFNYYPKTTYGSANYIIPAGVTISNLVFYYPNQIKVVGTNASSTPLVYPWTIACPAMTTWGVNSAIEITIRNCFIVNAYKAIYWNPSRGSLTDLKIGAFNQGIEIDGSYDFAFLDTIEILPAFAALPEGSQAGAVTNVERNYCVNNLYGLTIKYADAISVNNFMMFWGYCGIRLASSTLGAGYGTITNAHIDSVYHGVMFEATKGPGWSFVNYSAEIFSYTGTSAIWCKSTVGGDIGNISWTGGGYYNNTFTNALKFDAGIACRVKVSNVNRMPNTLIHYSYGTASLTTYTSQGIGVVNPTQALHVAGKIRIGDDSVFTSLGGGELRYGNSAGIFDGYNGTAGVWEKFSNYGITLLTVNSTTPDVAGGKGFKTANTSATSITNFTGGFEGQEITITFTDANTTIVNGATIKLAGAVNFVATTDDILTLQSLGGVWREKSRSVN